MIKLYLFKNDVILDPFVGSGTTCLSALKNQRNYIGYDVNAEYVKLADRIISDFKNQGDLFKS